MRSLLFLVILFSSLANSKEITFSVANENICSLCSVDVKQMIDALPLPELQNRNQNQVAIALSHSAQVQRLESAAINRLASDMAQADLGSQLIQKSIDSNAISYRLFYQVGLDQNGLTSLRSSRAKAAYEIDKQDPHELWGFFQSIDGRGYILLNEYQHPRNAIYTLTHELMHLFDEKTRVYIENQRTMGKWTALDQMAVEFRALLAEAVVYAQLQNKQKKGISTDILAGQDLHRTFINKNGQINLEKLSQHVLSLFYPLEASSTFELVAGSEESAFDAEYSSRDGYQAKPWPLSGNTLKNGILDILSRFLGESITRCSTDKCPLLSLVLLNYQKSESIELKSWAADQRRQISEELLNRGAKDLLQYFENNDLVSDLTSGLHLRQSGINGYIHSTGGPSPRLGGGTLRVTDPASSRIKLDVKIENKEKTLDRYEQKNQIDLVKPLEPKAYKQQSGPADSHGFNLKFESVGDR